MLSDETREGMRQAAEGVSADLTDKARAATIKAANRIKALLTTEFGDDEAAARAAYMLASTFSALRYTTVRDLDTILSGSRDTYALVAGSLAGVYTLPAEEDAAPGDENVIVLAPEAVEDDAPSPGTGMYL